MILSFAEFAELVGCAVAVELGASRADGARTLAEWALGRPEGDPGLEAFSGLLDGLAAQALAAVTVTRDDRSKAGAVA